MTDSHQTLGMFFDVSGYFNVSMNIALIILTLVFVILKKNLYINTKIFSLSLLFVVYLFFNFELESNLGIAKLFMLVSILTILVLNKSMLTSNRGLVGLFLKWIIILSSIKVILFLLLVDISFINLISNPSQVRFQYSYFLNPIYLARSCGLAVLALMFLSEDKLNKVIISSLYIILFLGLYMSGSRAPVLALIAVFITKYAFSNQKEKYITLMLSFVFASFLMIAFHQELYSIFHGFIVRDNDSIDSAIEDRFTLLLTAKNMFLNHPIFGEGLGSFSYYSYLGYPHNIFMEVLSELGLVGAIFLFLLLVTGFRLPKNDIFFLMFFFCFVNALSSGSFSNNVAILIVVFWGRYLKNKHVNN